MCGVYGTGVEMDCIFRVYRNFGVWVIWMPSKLKGGNEINIPHILMNGLKYVGIYTWIGMQGISAETFRGL